MQDVVLWGTLSYIFSLWCPCNCLPLFKTRWNLPCMISLETQTGRKTTVKCTGTTGMSVNGLGADQRGGGYQVRVHQVKAPSAALCHWGLKDDSNVLGWQCFESWMIRLTWKLFQFEEIQRHSFCDANFRSVLKFEKEKTQNSMEIPTVG